MLLDAFFAFPFQIRQCDRATSVTIIAFAAVRVGSTVPSGFAPVGNSRKAQRICSRENPKRSGPQPDETAGLLSVFVKSSPLNRMDAR
jgi:hypothetical protein